MDIKVYSKSEKATSAEVAEMLSAHSDFIKLAVDIRDELVAGGGEFHADCEAALIVRGSKQDFIWGADWIPSTKELRFEALINIRPRLKNPSTTVLEPQLREKIRAVVLPVFSGT